MKARVYYSDDFLRHDWPGHVERRERLEATMSRLRGGVLAEKVEVVEPRPATADEVGSVHAPWYVRYILEHGEGMLDLDTYMSEGSAIAALRAAGAAVEGVDEALSGRRLVVGMVRPPGHHALPAQAMGFCLFNNAAIGAKHALRRAGRVLIIDWDVHHGNGTELVFYDNPRVLYFSVHQSPLFPGTGAAPDAGVGEGEGFNVNVPLPAGSTDADYAEAFGRILLPIMDDYGPGLVIVSAGYDPHYADPIADMRMTEAGFYALASMVRGGSKNASIVVMLEGGYSLEHLPSSVEASLLGLMGEPYDYRASEEKTGAAAGRIAEALEVQRKYWRL
ncbi:histone deacetylase family protein [Methanocella conradii]|uniref:histone deacetylase family protein n=1 Tax=Methanocella conradii TaxID=1175444 RepID=UPI0024B3B065|nr:histone deacetylase [Methanocella conradii]MDI6897377.1 histone deacetylase [Methanocella conradii]